jgi:hydrogenase maturation protease
MDVLPLVAGLGSPHGDDQIGWLVAQRLDELAAGSVRVVLLSNPIDLLNVLDGTPRLIVIDACRGIGPIGACHRWLWPTEELAATRASGTHAVSLEEVLRMARQLACLPAYVSVWGIEGQSFSPSDELAPELAGGIPHVVRQIVAAEFDEVFDDA